MSSRSLRRTAAVVTFATLLAPVSGFAAAQSQAPRGQAPASAERHNPVMQAVLWVLAQAGVHTDAGMTIDGNGNH